MNKILSIIIVFMSFLCIDGCSSFASKIASSFISPDSKSLQIDAQIGDNGLKSGEVSNSGNNSGTINGGPLSAKFSGHEIHNNGIVDDQVNGLNVDTSNSKYVEINSIKDSYIIWLIFIIIAMMIGWFMDSPVLVIKKFLYWRKGLEMKIVWVKKNHNENYY